MFIHQRYIKITFNQRHSRSLELIINYDPNRCDEELIKMSFSISFSLSRWRSSLNVTLQSAFGIFFLFQANLFFGGNISVQAGALWWIGNSIDAKACFFFADFIPAFPFLNEAMHNEE